MAKTTEIDEDLVKGLKAAKSKRSYFVLILKGSKDGALILAKAKVPPASIADAKKKSGGAKAIRGLCQYEDGTYVFEVAKEPPATAAQAVKLIVKRDAGMTVKAEFRVGTDAELLGEDEELLNEGEESTAPEATPVPTDNGADVIARLKAMSPDIKAALAGPNKARVQTLFVAVSGQIKSSDFAAARTDLDELEPLLKQAPSPDGAELTSRLNAIKADIKSALTGPNKARVQSLFVSVSGELKNQAFAAAAQGLDELEKLVKPATSGDPKSAWEAARKTAIAKLNAIAAKVKAAKHPKSDIALLQLKAVAMNIPAEVSTPQKVSETVAYLQHDDVVLDVCQFAEDIRTPLLAILARLNPQSAA